MVIIIALLVSAFFSGMEIAYFSSNKLRLEIQKKQSGLYSHISTLFARHPGQYLSTILVGNNIALVVYSMAMSGLLQRVVMGGRENFLVETAISTLVVIFVAEFLPKAVVKANPNLYLRIFSVPLYVFYLVFYPIARFATILATAFLRIFGLRLSKEPKMSGFDKIDLALLVDQAADTNNQLSNENELKMLQNALDFSDLRVRECMIPRIDIQAIDITDSVEELRKLFIKTNFSRIPVYRESVDTIIGYVHSRELFNNPTSIDEMLRQIIYVPESAGVQKLLSLFIKNRKSLAVVIDEFGSTAGMVTIEDILEEIFGEIEDEHDADYLVDKQISDNKYVFSGRMEVDYLNAEYELGIPESEQYETLAGFILDYCKDLPDVGEVITIEHLTIKIVRATSSRISLVELEVED